VHSGGSGADEVDDEPAMMNQEMNENKREQPTLPFVQGETYLIVHLNATNDNGTSVSHLKRQQAPHHHGRPKQPPRRNKQRLRR
jgi:hypothetical protein